MRASFFFVVVLASSLAAIPQRARACGGCFYPPTGSPSSVDAHRMVLAVSPLGTTLWDQIVYAGEPDDFVWVLPVASDARVVLADNGFFEALTRQTQIVMQAPLPPPTRCGDPCLGWGFIASDASGDARRWVPPVEVHHQGVVGPYETATIESDDPSALLTWMNDNGYVVDDALLPVIEHYVTQGLSFAVLRLQPGLGVDRMRPVRVTTPGLSTTLPLRMVAAGTQIDLDLELFVFAESRMEAASFGNAEVDREAITYDWASATFDYETHFENALFEGEGTAPNWVTEYALPITSWSTLEAYQSRGSDGTVNRARDDVGVVRRALPDTAYLTRLRTRFGVNDLREDLNLRASSGTDLESLITVTREIHRAPGPVCPTVCPSGGGLGPGGSTTRGTGASYRCSARSRSSRGLMLLVVLCTIAAGRRTSRARR